MTSPLPSTRAALDDLRVLKLAEMYDRAFEAFIRDTALRVAADDRVAASLLRLAEPTGRRVDRVSREIESILSDVKSDEKRAVARATLLDVVELERASRQFYLEHADRVHDPRLAALFRGYARDQMRHIRLAEDLLALAH